jgi:hypothetical protein
VSAATANDCEWEMIYGDLSGLASGSSFDVDGLRERLRKMSDAELIPFGKRMRGLVYPHRYGGDGKPSSSA